jgi:hypothetical protein
MTTRLELYNDALTVCGERVLASLTESRESRRLLDQVWDSDGYKACLEAGQWRFAMRSVQLDYDTDITPSFGYQRAFLKPSDWCATSAVCTDEYFNTPLLAYSDEAGYWYADLDTIYVRYVSNDSAYGGDLSKWTTRFTDYVAAHFAAKIILKLTSDQNRWAATIKLEEMRKSIAKNHDAMSDSTKFAPTGSWVRARGGRKNRDNGNRGTLIG